MGVESSAQIAREVGYNVIIANDATPNADVHVKRVHSPDGRAGAQHHCSPPTQHVVTCGVSHHYM